jgi:hypothetical protein
MKIRFDIENFTTLNRLINLLSKSTIPDSKNKKEMNDLVDNYVKDILDELLKHCENKDENILIWEQEIEENEKNQIIQDLKNDCKKIIFEHFKKMNWL